MVTDFPQPVSGTVVPRFGDVATFMRLPVFRDPAEVEIGMVGVPWDGGTTNRPGARHGPRQMRDLSTMMRRVHHVTGVAPYELAKCGDLGDASVNPASLDDSLVRIEKHFARIHAAGTVPLSAGGDHLVTLPIMRAIAKGGPLGMVHFDAHSDTWDTYFGGYTPHEAQRMLRGLRGLNLVGGDVVEVSPPFDMSGNTALVGVTMMWEILCLLAESVARRKGRL